MTPTTSRVIWLLPALRQLRQAQAQAYLNGGPGALSEIQNQVSARLAALYPDSPVVVLQQYAGFRPNPGQFIYLVEVVRGNEPARFIVKLDGQEELRRELNAWASCRPSGLHHDPVLMMLRPLPDEERLDGLQYADAQQFIGGNPVYLEDAFLDAVRFGSPAPSSLAEVFSLLYGRLAYLLYPTATVEEPAAEEFVLDVPRLAASLAAWRAEGSTAAAVVEDVKTAVAREPGLFEEPVEYLTFVRDCCRWRDQSGPTSHDRPVRPARYVSSPALRAAVVPRILRGCAHGDLHGRNVLVGVAHERARWPALFDYEAMSPRNWLAWDFVKMETELKARAYPHLFENEQSGVFIDAIQRFETALAEQTERCYNGARWPVVNDEEPTAAGRLQALLLALRRLASLHLGAEHGRSRDWLDEWYFAQACYGIHVGRFANLERPHLIGAYVAAGVASGRFYSARRREQTEGLSLTFAAEGEGP